MNTPKKILAIRNDKLGDFMLVWPALSLLKNIFPDCELSVLVPDYTSPMAELCTWIDHIVIDRPKAGLGNAFTLAKIIKEHDYDAVIDFHPASYTALSIYLSGVAHRFAPASRLVQLFYNHRLTQRRSRSEKPEFEYNLDLARFMAQQFDRDSTITPASPPYLSIAQSECDSIRLDYCSRYNIENDKKLIMIHPGSGGSALNLKLDDYARIISMMANDPSLHFVITAGPGEEQTAQELSGKIQQCSHAVYISRNGLGHFAKFISIADIFISGSTGVLHIAGALDVPTVAFYPARRSATALRWHTINSSNRRLAFSSNTDGGQYIKIDIRNCYQQIKNKLLT